MKNHDRSDLANEILFSFRKHFFNNLLQKKKNKHEKN